MSRLKGLSYRVRKLQHAGGGNDGWDAYDAAQRRQDARYTLLVFERFDKPMHVIQAWDAEGNATPLADTPEVAEARAQLVGDTPLQMKIDHETVERYHLRHFRILGPVPRQSAPDNETMWENFQRFFELCVTHSS